MTVFNLLRNAIGLAACGLMAMPVCAQNADVSREENLTRLKTVDFQLERGAIVSSNEFAFIAEILGSSITSGSTPIPVTAHLRVENSIVSPWGNFVDPVRGNVNTPERPEVYLHPEILEEGVGVTIGAQSYIPSRRGRYSRHISASTAFQSDFVIALRDGDPVPNIQGFNDQQNAVEFVSDYIVDDHIRLHDNQVIYLFELGTANLNSAAADFQDLVVIVTLAETVEELEEVVSGPSLNYD